MRTLFITLFFLFVVLAVIASPERSSMNPLNTSRYFPDPKVAAFVDDVQRGDAERVSDALKDGINPNATGKDGFQPIHFVFSAKTAKVARILLAAGADPNARIANKNTPLHFAVQSSNPDFTDVFLEYGADPNAKGESDKSVLINALASPQSGTILRMLTKAGVDINHVWGGFSPLQAAIVALQLESAVTLLELGADPTVRSSHR